MWQCIIESLTQYINSTSRDGPDIPIAVYNTLQNQKKLSTDTILGISSQMWHRLICNLRSNSKNVLKSYCTSLTHVMQATYFRHQWFPSIWTLSQLFIVVLVQFMVRSKTRMVGITCISTRFFIETIKCMLLEIHIGCILSVIFCTSYSCSCAFWP